MSRSRFQTGVKAPSIRGGNGAGRLQFYGGTMHELLAQIDWQMAAPAMVGAYVILSTVLRIVLFTMRLGMAVCIGFVCVHAGPDLLPILAKMI